ncbi:MAG: hypothetical protein ACI4EF_01920 [Coprococcus sp.]
MNLKCPNCGGSVVLNPETGMMECVQCKSSINDSFSDRKTDLDIAEDILFDKEIALEFAKKDRAVKYLKNSKDNIGDNENEIGISDDDKAAYMSMNIYNCTSCGARLMINDKETSTFCAYCGQPTIVFERVSEELQPDLIIPFTVTKEVAVNLIKEKLMKGKYVPNEIKNFKIDKLRGIYIPFWLVSTKNRTAMKLSGTRTKTTGVGSGESEDKPVNLFRDMECDFDRITVDATRRLNDNISRRLEPYDMRQLKPFDIGYLSGFYADKYDVPAEEAVYMAKKRSIEFMKPEIFDSCDGVNNISIRSEDNKVNITDIEYAMLPAWFITFRYKGIIYTIVVNGQTGKVVGNVPVDKARVGAAIGILSIVVTFVTTMISLFAGNMWYDYQGSSDAKEGIDAIYCIIVPLVLFSFYIFITGISRAKAAKMDRYRFKGSSITKYVKKRQDKTWVR